MFVESLLLDMFSLGIPLLRGGVRVLIFHKVSFEKHSSVHPPTIRADQELSISTEVSLLCIFVLVPVLVSSIACRVFFALDPISVPQI